MVLKTFVAATCAAVLAGSMVYFSTVPGDSGGMVKLDPANSEKIDTGETGEKPKLFRRYINSKDDADQAENSDNPYSATELTGGEDSQTTTTTTTVTETITENVVEVDPAEVEIPVADLPAEIIEDEIEQRRAALPPRETNRPVRPTKDRSLPSADNNPAKAKVAAVFEQAENISQSDLRDRAYLDLADFATANGLFGEAETAALKIAQVELRDTARSRIAMGMARYGLSDEAFDLIEEVEVDELRDVMRLQVIEALLGTDMRR